MSRSPRPRHPLRTAWSLPVPDGDPYAQGDVREWALPADLSAELDHARERLRLPTLTAIGVPALPAETRDAALAPSRERGPVGYVVPTLTMLQAYWRDGVRTTYEAPARELGIQTAEAVLAALATGTGEDVDRAADGLYLLCETSTWAWPAHEQAHDRRGWTVPDPDEPVLDLGAGQNAHVLAFADAVLGEVLNDRVPGLRERLRREVRIRVFEPYLRRRDWHWLQRTAHNWTGWIHQNLVASALLLLDREEDRTMRDNIVAAAIAQADRYLETLPADGGIDEGYNYYWNGAARLLENIELLDRASGGRLDLRAAAATDPTIVELLRFPQRLDLGDGWVVSMSDGPARAGVLQPWGVLRRWGTALDLPDVRAYASAKLDGGAGVAPRLGLGRALAALADAIEAATGPGEDTRATADDPTAGEHGSWFPELELLVAHAPVGPRLTLAIKGAHNNEAHNHLDVGSYLVAVDSAPVLADLGQHTYHRHSFTERRYENWSLTSSWHNLPEIRGVQQGVGAEFRARDLEAILPSDGPQSSGPGGLSLDLAGAYPEEAGVVRYRREATLLTDGAGTEGADGSATVVVSDRWEMGPGPAGAQDVVVLNHVLAGTVQEHRAGALRIRALSGSLVELGWDPALGEGAFETRPVEDALLEQSWGPAVHRLRLTVPATQDGAEVTVRAITG